MSANRPGPILVINPNSNGHVTDGLVDALAPFETTHGPAIECLTLAEGPFGIQSQIDSDSVILPLTRLVQSRPDASAHVIACYSDPGLDACRLISPVPVFGIQDAGVLTVMARADLFGVIAVAEPLIARHRRTMARMGVLGRLVGEIALNMSVDETARGAGTFDRLVETGGALRDQGAGAIILGCAGMARHRKGLEAALGVAVVDPVQAATAMALGTVLAANI
ncbi:aspartate/glutamate racemase family protein [Roseovarius sp. C7]|uniref:aspartate/glutamate racemase family protein n=1 Tax=Roseovarius sp. C7 TaxID=3398643 RepID=UPI0039F6570E